MGAYSIVDVDNHGHAALTVLGLGTVEPQGTGVVDGDSESLFGDSLTFDQISVSTCCGSSGGSSRSRGR